MKTTNDQINIFDEPQKEEEGGKTGQEDGKVTAEFYDCDGKVRAGVIVSYDSKKETWIMDSWGERYVSHKLRRIIPC